MKHLIRFNESSTDKREKFYKEYKDLLYYQNNLEEFDEEDNEFQDDELESEIWEIVDKYGLSKDDIDWILKNKDTSFDDVSYAQSIGFLKRISDSDEWLSDVDKIRSEFDKEFSSKSPSPSEKMEWYHKMRNKGFDGIEIFNSIPELHR